MWQKLQNLCREFGCKAATLNWNNVTFINVHYAANYSIPYEFDNNLNETMDEAFLGRVRRRLEELKAANEIDGYWKNK